MAERTRIECVFLCKLMIDLSVDLIFNLYEVIIFGLNQQYAVRAVISKSTECVYGCENECVLCTMIIIETS